MQLPKHIYFFLLILLSGFISSCDILGAGPCLEGKGPLKTETRDVPAFRGVDMRLPGNVLIGAGPKAEISIKGYENVLPEIITEVSGNTLIIRSQSCLEFSNNAITFTISLPQIENVELKSSGEITVQSVPAAKRVRLTLSGSGSIRYNGAVTRLNLLHSGSGDIMLNGTAQNVETTLSGSGRIQGYDMPTDTAKTLLTGSGYQKVWVHNYLDVTITGSGNVFYKGKPVVFNSYTTSSGRVINEN